MLIISYNVQGLQNAVAYLLPHAEHRNCARHIYANWKKKGHSTQLLQKLFWKAVKATTQQDFKKIMSQINTLEPQAAEDFQAVGVMKFCRAYISEWPKCEMIDNNICECFNNYILHSRGKPIIDMLEDIRIAVMQRIVEKRELFSDTIDELCPRIRKVLEDNKFKSRTCTPTHAGDHRFEVTEFGNRFVVDLPATSCSCRYWNIACIHWIKHDPAIFVTDWLKKDAYQLAYNYTIPPMNGKTLWDEVEGTYVFPPFVRRQPGRPKRNRRVDLSEKEVKGSRLSKKGVQMKCSICHQVGHNRLSCTRRMIQAANQVEDAYQPRGNRM